MIIESKRLPSPALTVGQHFAMPPVADYPGDPATVTATYQIPGHPAHPCPCVSSVDAGVLHSTVECVNEPWPAFTLITTSDPA